MLQSFSMLNVAKIYLLKNINKKYCTDSTKIFLIFYYDSGNAAVIIVLCACVIVKRKKKSIFCVRPTILNFFLTRFIRFDDHNF